MNEMTQNIAKSNGLLRVLISGGGTGGHIFPAVSIANALKRRCPEAEILFVGAEGRMEMEKVPAAGYDIVGLPVAGFDRKRLWRNAGVLIKLMRSMRKARKVLKKFNPDIAVGVGGYASGPMLKQAQKNNIPTLLQEQNSYAGVTNKLLAAKARAICVAYEGMERFFPAEVIELTGNPVRSNLLNCILTPAQAKEALGMNPSVPLVLVVGGSLGARTVNEAISRALPDITATGANVLWQCGKLYAEKCCDRGAQFEGVKVQPFIADMDVAYRAADLLVSRAGAATISEIQLLGKAAILIPSPNVAEDHQRKNAEALSSRGAAVMIPDAEACQRLGAEVTALLNDGPKRTDLSRAASKMALPDADEKIVDRILEIVSEK